MGGTTELAGNFVPVDERLVSFFVFKSRSAEDAVLCRGVGCPHKILFILAAAGGKKGQIT